MSGAEMAAELRRDMGSAAVALFKQPEWIAAAAVGDRPALEHMVSELVKACANNTACGWADLVNEPSKPESL